MGRIIPSAHSARHVERAEAHDLTTDGVSDAARAIYAAPPLRIPPLALAALVAPFDAVLTEDRTCAGCTELLSAGAAVVGVGTSGDGLPLLAYCSAACRTHRNAQWREALGRGSERTEVVRADLADSARRLGHRCIAREIERATTPDAWGDVAHDLDRVGVTQDDRALARSTARAVRLLARGDLDGAVAELADFCGLSVDKWERDARAEQGR